MLTEISYKICNVINFENLKLNKADNLIQLNGTLE